MRYGVRKSHLTLKNYVIRGAGLERYQFYYWQANLEAHMQYTSRDTNQHRPKLNRNQEPDPSNDDRDKTMYRIIVIRVSSSQ